MANGELDQRGNVADVELFHQPGTVRFDRADREGAQEMRKAVGDHLVVIGDEDADRHFAGIVTVMTVPFPVTDSTSSVPPSACARSRIVTSP